MNFESLKDRARPVVESKTEIGILIWFVGFFLYVIAPPIIDPYGDGLWYGVTSLVGGLLIGYGYAT